MPMKCMAQMPLPIASAPPAIQKYGARPWAWRTRIARLRAVYDARMATRIDTKTSRGS